MVSTAFTLLAIPFFLIAGEVMAREYGRSVVRLATTYVGHRQGGLGYVAIMTSAISLVFWLSCRDAAALVSILYSTMKSREIPRSTFNGLLASGGIIAPVIPPSILIILLLLAVSR